MQVAAIKQLAVLGTDLTMDERNLLSVGFKHVVGTCMRLSTMILASCESAAPLRNQWRVISSIEERESDKDGSSKQAAFIKVDDDGVLHLHLTSIGYRSTAQRSRLS